MTDDGGSTEMLVQELAELHERAGSPAHRDLARKIGRSPAAVAEVLRGEGSRDTLRRVVAGLDGDVTAFDDLFTNGTPPPPVAPSRRDLVTNGTVPSPAAPGRRVEPQVRVQPEPSGAASQLLCRYCLEGSGRIPAITVIDGNAVCADHFERR